MLYDTVCRLCLLDANGIFAWSKLIEIASLMKTRIAIAICLLWAWQAKADCLPAEIIPMSPGYEMMYDTTQDSKNFHVIDPAKRERMKALRQAHETSATAYLKHITRYALQRGIAEDDKQCAQGILLQWAQGGHLATPPQYPTEEMRKQAVFETKWAIWSIAITYHRWLKPGMSLAQRQQVERWLKTIAYDVLYSAYGSKLPRDANNHYYAHGTALMAIGVAIDDKHLIRIGRQTYEYGVDRIQDDGVLLREVARKSEARHYHGFALLFLSLTAKMSGFLGEDWLAYKPERLQRLTALAEQVFADPAFAAQKFAYEQSAELFKPCGAGIAWTQLWPVHDPRLLAMRPQAGQCMNMIPGGDLAGLVQGGLFDFPATR